ncbi:BEN domain-containing protein 3-like [Acipenser ruthenus]|uniref:BEN domain-containing protein 3-like n=1 Tax=Acipenser ruthenus TaxID=7906 RepID=UPI0027423557|nr:BEN domain-containing protein 3-like [Acipenser ruthenus]
MNFSEYGEDSEGEISEKERRAVHCVKIERKMEDTAIDCTAGCKITEGHKLMLPCTSLQITKKRTQTQTQIVEDGPGNEQDMPTSKKKIKFAAEGMCHGFKTTEHLQAVQRNMGCTGTLRLSNMMSLSENKDFPNEKTKASYRKPLYSISHKITEKKNTPGLDQHTSPHEPRERVNYNSLVLPKKVGEHNRREPSVIVATPETTSSDSNVYSLIEKMFFILNTLNSSMTQLHSKVDLLSLEVTRIKKRINPPETVAEFHPPPEYQLNSEELKQLMQQTSLPGDLACRLLVQLFPELFTVDGFNRCCNACGIVSKKKLDSLHLQLIRNYVEVCYPLIKNGNAWQVECLPQINDFFNRFWAQKDMESSQQCQKAAPTTLCYEPEQPQACHYIDEEGQDESSSLTSNNNTASDLILDTQDVVEYLDEASSPGDFAVYLMHRLFPELFQRGRMTEGYSCYSGSGKQSLDPQRLQIIRKYMEIYFPDIQDEESWIQLCVQRMEEELGGMHANGNESEHTRDESFDSSSLPDDVSIVKVGDSEFEKRGKRFKKVSLVPIDFDSLEFPPPDFEVPPEYVLTKEQIKNNYECSLSIGNFASHLLVQLFPELFTSENMRKYYNCSGTLGKKQLDPVRINLIRYYVQLLYARAKNDRVWTLEFVGKLDERCRRRDTEQRRSYQQQRKVYIPESDSRDFDGFPLNTERFREEFEGPPLPPERSTKDFCKIPLEELAVPPVDFAVPSVYLLSNAEIREIVQQSLSVGNFAARLLVRLFQELFTVENLRLQYNHSGACNKKQLDPVRLRLIRHYVEAVYPVDKMEEVWHYECIPSIDERCRRPNRKKCDILKKAKRAKDASYS